MKQALLKWMLAGAIALGLSPAMAVAQSQDDNADSGPGLGVARISLTNGDVTVRRGDSGDWIAGRVNQPVLVEDSVATGATSRAELQLDSANLLRLNESTEVNLAELADRKFRVEVSRGTVNYSEFKDAAADVDIETPLVVVRPQDNGEYRVQVTEDGETIVIVRDGKAEVASNEGVQTVGKGRMLIVRGDPTGQVEFREERAMGRDDWDRWNDNRDKQLENSKSYKYVSRSITGAEDLDNNGRWVYTEPYGQVWYPTVSPDWAPYRYGNWEWVDYYGWTWVGYEPWGWAPYHYGRWCNSPVYGWGWYPGYRYADYYWSPALVGFFGWNSYSGWSGGIGFGFGNVGWFPLAPYERYHPWYGHGYRGGHGGNTIYVDNSVNIYNTYKNARVHNGTTVVDAESFSKGRVNNPQTLRSAELRRATMVRGQIPVVPAGESRGRVVRAANSGNPSSRANTGLLGRNGARQSGALGRGGASSTRASRRVPFADQQQQVAQSVRAFNESSQRREAGSVRGGTVAGGASPGNSGGRSVVRGGAGDNSGGASSVRGQSDARGSVGGNSTPAGRLGSPDATASAAESTAGTSVRGNSDRGLFNQSRRLGTRAGTDTNGVSGSTGAETNPSSVRSSGSRTTTGNDGWRRFGGRETPSTATSRSGVSSGDSGSRVNRGIDPVGRSSSRVPSASSSSSGSSGISRPSVGSGRSRIDGNSGSSFPAPSAAPSVRSRSSGSAPSSPRAAPRSSPAPSASPRGGGSDSRSSPRTRTSSGPRSSLGSGAGSASPRFVPRTSSRISGTPGSRATSRATNISPNRSSGYTRQSANISPGRSSSRVSSRSASAGSYVPRSSSRVGSYPRGSGSSANVSAAPRGSESRSSRYSAPTRSRGGGYGSPPQTRSYGGYSQGSVSRGGSMPRSSAPSVSRGGGYGGSIGRSSGGGGGYGGSIGRSSGGGYRGGGGGASIGRSSGGGGSVRSSSGGGGVRSSGGHGGGRRR